MKHSSKLFLFAAVIAALATSFQSCKKDDESDPYFEPISISIPDSTWIKGRANEEIPLKARFTIDRAIEEITIRSHRDSTGAGFDPLSTDSVFLARFDSIYPKVNIYDYEGVYKVPAESKVGDIIRLQFRVKADTLERTKIVRIDVRL